MELDKDFKGHEQWKEGTRQTIIGEPGDTREDAVKFMHAHLEYFKLGSKFTFNAGHIVQNGNEFIVTINQIGGNPTATKFRLGNGVIVEYD